MLVCHTDYYGWFWDGIRLFRDILSRRFPNFVLITGFGGNTRVRVQKAGFVVFWWIIDKICCCCVINQARPIYYIFFFMIDEEGRTRWWYVRLPKEEEGMKKCGM